MSAHHVVDAYANRKKNDVMKDTWGHMYPEPGSKHSGTMIVCCGQYGDCTILRSDFPTLQSSPQRYQLEHEIFSNFEFEDGEVYKVGCTLWFFKKNHDMYLGEDIGKIIKVDAKKVKL